MLPPFEKKKWRKFSFEINLNSCLRFSVGQLIFSTIWQNLEVKPIDDLFLAQIRIMLARFYNFPICFSYDSTRFSLYGEGRLSKFSIPFPTIGTVLLQLEKVRPPLTRRGFGWGHVRIIIKLDWLWLDFESSNLIFPSELNFITYQ